MTTAAIVLAGGRSSRFGRDKLAEPVEGIPMLERAVGAVASVVGEVLVVVAPGSSAPIPAGARRINDARAFEGPLAGVDAGLAGTDAEIVLVVGGDMPSLVPAVLRRLIDALADPTVDAAVLEAGGRHRPLPMGLRRGPAVAITATLLASDERRLRALRDGLALAVIRDVVWQVDDPAGATLRDIDRPDDLGA
jgi:molybdopterin-guanine dinucleotide biosynthesis protein A